jgi:hypothetical protein
MNSANHRIVLLALADQSIGFQSVGGQRWTNWNLKTVTIGSTGPDDGKRSDDSGGDSPRPIMEAHLGTGVGKENEYLIRNLPRGSDRIETHSGHRKLQCDPADRILELLREDIRGTRVTR